MRFVQLSSAVAQDLHPFAVIGGDHGEGGDAFFDARDDRVLVAEEEVSGAGALR